MSSRQSRREARGKGQTRAQARQGNQPKNRTMLYIGGSALLLIALVVFGIFRAIPGTTASDFEVVAYTGQETLGGYEINFISLLDQDKPIILNFWAGNCPPVAARCLASRVCTRRKVTTSSCWAWTWAPSPGWVPTRMLPSSCASSASANSQASRRTPNPSERTASRPCQPRCSSPLTVRSLVTGRAF